MHKNGDVVRAADVVHGNNRGMVERGCGPGFLLEPPQAIMIGCVSGGQDLDRDVATETRVVRQIDLAHPARAQRARIRTARSTFRAGGS